MPLIYLFNSKRFHNEKVILLYSYITISFFKKHSRIAKFIIIWIIIVGMSFIFHEPCSYYFVNSFILINPHWVTGFFDAECSFTCNIVKSNKYRAGWFVQLSFSIGLHKKDKAIMEQIKSYLGAGKITEQGHEAVRLRIDSIQEFSFLINHLEKYPLITQKRVDYLLWKQIVEIMLKKEHLTREGLEKIVALKAGLNWGLSSDLKAAFPNVKAVTRAIIKNPQISDPQWLAGFTSGEGCFLVSIYDSKTSLGVAVKLIFQITQHIKDELLLKSFIGFFSDRLCDNIVKDRETYHYRVTKFNGIYEIIIPFFFKYPVIGVKSKDFQDFCVVADLMKEKKHLTAEGLEQIRLIKAGMNTGRD